MKKSSSTDRWNLWKPGVSPSAAFSWEEPTASSVEGLERSHPRVKQLPRESSGHQQTSALLRTAPNPPWLFTSSPGTNTTATFQVWKAAFIHLISLESGGTLRQSLAPPLTTTTAGGSEAAAPGHTDARPCLVRTIRHQVPPAQMGR